MNKQMASSIGIALFLLAGCAAPGPKLASSAQDIAGAWHSNFAPTEIQFNEDGTLRLRGSGVDIAAEFRFEGTRLFWKAVDPASACVLEGAEVGVYEVELLENGNLKFTAIEDECSVRPTVLEGPPTVEVEWEPVP